MTHFFKIMENNLLEKNVLFITLDSCRFDTVEQADIPTIKSLGKLRKAYTHATYTVPAHTAFFAGHLPVVLDNPPAPYYSESVRQLWRIKTGAGSEKKVGLALEGNNILEGYRKLGFYVLGVGGVTQFNDGSQLRSYFEDDFLYYGLNLDEEPLGPRKKENFPLHHVDEIITKLKGKDKWFLFINCPETHYPYDTGDGISGKIEKWYPKLKQQLNLREAKEELSIPDSIYSQLHSIQKHALEYIDKGIGTLIEKLPKDRETLVVICGDHGENFGEYFLKKRRWGHMLPSKEVLGVPLLIGMIQ